MQRKWAGYDNMDGLSQGEGCGCKTGTARTGGKPIDNFLTQSRAKERNEKHQKRKKEKVD